MIVEDLAKTLKFINKKFGEPKKVIVLASSTGSLAIFASQLEPVLDTLALPQINYPCVHVECRMPSRAQ